MVSQLQDTLTIANTNVTSTADDAEDDDEEDDNTELAWQQYGWKEWQAGTQKADGLWGILKR